MSATTAKPNVAIGGFDPVAYFSDETRAPDSPVAPERLAAPSREKMPLSFSTEEPDEAFNISPPPPVPRQ